MCPKIREVNKKRKKSMRYFNAVCRNEGITKKEGIKKTGIIKHYEGHYEDKHGKQIKASDIWNARSESLINQ